ncbi:MAG: ATP-binding cassette domain-containing protein [Candidatus Dojkabacteria bacterium]|nr:ATP-binding cassette domain-containing protein [Candidatus Dojkabacteria bacterium]
MVRFDTVTKKYDGNIVALEDVNFDIKQGEFCFITGPSGAGKSTIVKLLIQDELPTSGSIFYEDIEVPKIPHKMLPSYRQKLGVVFQDMKLLNTRTLTENIAFALEILQKKEQEIKNTTDYLLELVGLEDRRNLYPDQLSGGEQQRGAIARALASNPSLLLADEPTGNLDEENAYMILDILKKINDSGTTIMVITHDNILVKAEKNNAREIHLDEGKVVSDTKSSKTKEVNKPEKIEEKKEPINEAMGDQIEDIQPKEEKSKMETELTKLSKGLVEKFEKNAIYSTDLLLGLTQGDLKNLKLKKKEVKELRKYIKNYLSNKSNDIKKKS